MSIVLDSSVVAAWYIGAESSPYALAVRAAVAVEGALVPSLWPYEVTNMLLVAERRGRISAADVPQALNALAALPIDVRPAMSRHAATGLARIASDYRLSAYDASYLDTAVRTGSSLATLDHALTRAARRAGIPLFPA